jgi:hypothetical protein
MSYTPQKIKSDGTIELTPEIVDVIVDGIKNENKKVREAAYSTWVSIVELESNKVTDDMIDKISKALKTYD